MTTIKKEYAVGDKAWIYGIAAGPGYNKLTEGTVVKVVDIDGYSETHYIISVTSSIEDLLEVRTWHSMSQDAKGPVGSFRELLMNDPSTQRKLLQTGLRLPVDLEMNPALLEDEAQDQTAD